MMQQQPITPDQERQYIEDARKKTEQLAVEGRELAKQQYKRDMMLQLVRNEELTKVIQSAYQDDTRDQFHSVIGELADKLTEEAFK